MRKNDVAVIGPAARQYYRILILGQRAGSFLINSLWICAYERRPSWRLTALAT
jgi:hypothetical protein